MNRSDIRNDFFSRTPATDPHVEKLMEAIHSSSIDTRKLLKLMTTILVEMSKKEPQPTEKPEVNINFDVEALAAALIKNRPEAQKISPPEIRIDAPVIDMKAALGEIELKRDSVSYEFTMKRGSDGKLASVIANPYRG